MSARDVIICPVITESSMDAMSDKKYTFDVALDANKVLVRQAVEEVFGVKVKQVNIMNVSGKKKRQGQYVGFTAKRRKAIVTLTADSDEIKIFEDEK
ncbi:50S ribosomal protein L23 [Companilactobacillus alimentarius]|uniref:Large ribosomal subunit protein uL23 n=1 Tax=Companilactobacillus alimentarius DSM 20249 TaxID=1423720 RepID=A0A2K9HJ88_9LACO|nr:50S ribosomal protein L23 [Companilactobacillus alimentarius]AUI72589.1 50S ribosomal protein L23 [Companilactobacillus alimentarius DSM 20249]GEO45599.1 50S ribosomal protein L23 [Companilactobacillus alimentarius]